MYNNLATFTDYLYYYRNLSEDKIKNLTEDEYKLLKDFFFNGEQGHELKATFEEFKEYANRKYEA